MTALITKCGSAWEPEQTQVDRWQELYPDVRVQSELNAMAGWLESNSSKRKTIKGMARFCNAWLKRAQDRGGEGLAKPKGATISTRSMSMEDDLSHNFVDCPEIHKKFMEQFGQVFYSTGRVSNEAG